MIIDIEELKEELGEEASLLILPPPKVLTVKSNRAVFVPGNPADHEDEETDDCFECPHCNVETRVGEWTTSITIHAWQNGLWVNTRDDGQLELESGDTDTEYEEAEFLGLSCPHCGRNCDLPENMTRG